jgi:hypothetical protein
MLLLLMRDGPLMALLLLLWPRWLRIGCICTAALMLRRLQRKHCLLLLVLGLHLILGLAVQRTNLMNMLLRHSWRLLTLLILLQCNVT